MKWYVQILVNALIFVALAALIPGFHVSGFFVALIAALIYGVVNALIRPIAQLLSLPITILTLGIFSLIVNAFMLTITSWFFGSNFYFDSFWITLLVSFLLSIINSLISSGNSN